METPRRVGPSGANHMRLFSALAPALFSGVYTPTQGVTHEPLNTEPEHSAQTLPTPSHSRLGECFIGHHW